MHVTSSYARMIFMTQIHLLWIENIEDITFVLNKNLKIQII